MKSVLEIDADFLYCDWCHRTNYYISPVTCQ